MNHSVHKLIQLRSNFASSTRVQRLSNYLATGMTTGPRIPPANSSSSPCSPPMATNTTQRLTGLRNQFSKHNIGIYLILSQDEHQSEYTSESDNRRAFISGFTGSAGTAVVTLDKAALATDGRYFLQASKELDSNWELLKQGVQNVPTWQQWAVEQSVKSGGSNIGVDPKLISYSEVRAINGLLQEKGSSGSVIAINENLVDRVWGTERPTRSKSPIKVYPLEFCGKKFEDKLVDLRTQINKKNGSAFVVSALDDTAWLLNLRGENDVAFNPVFRSYAIVTLDDATLYVDLDKVTDEVQQHLGDVVQVKPYDEVFEDAKDLGLSLIKANIPLAAHQRNKLLVPSQASWALFLALGGENNVSAIPSPIELAKAIKNPVEIEGHRKAQIKDGVALIRYFSWLESQLKRGVVLTDYNAADKSTEFRRQMKNFVGLSFHTISASGPSAAIIHYAPLADSKEIVDINQVYLNDTGAQFLEGTTDTTRTFHFAEPKPEEKKAYTLVLKGHIAIATSVFPEGTTGFGLDLFARQYLWKEGLDYRHGTGHGVGAYLNVHEGPVGIGMRAAYNAVALQPGNIISNEPGYYEDGKFGIRIESIVLVKEIDTPNHFGDKKYLGFETLTQVPLCANLIDLELLTESEKDWINKYHDQVYNATKSYFNYDEPALKWLQASVEHI